MKNLFVLIVAIFSCVFSYSQNEHTDHSEQDTTKYILVIHGGAGVVKRDKMTPEKEREYRDKLTEALETGYGVLKSGKTSVDAVEATINVLEDSYLFNAGKGAVFSHDGTNNMDASIMNGENLKAGAVAGVSIVKNPIDAARAVMEKSEHVLLAGEGAEEFAKKSGCVIVDPSYFYTEGRWNQLLQVQQKKKGTGSIDHKRKIPTIYGTGKLDTRIGTVGCVALDNYGNLAAGTSTGGMTNKKYGRIGDSPIIGAGTYCNNLTAGISCTGWGEYFIREVAAYRVSALVELTGMTLDQAAKQVIKEISELGGDGGLIALDKNGNVAMPYSTDGMYRGTVDKDGNISVQIY